MAMADYQKAKAIIKAYDDEADFVGPRPEELVRKAEDALGVRFPPTYRRFLLEFGAGSLAGEEIYGVIHDNFEESSVPDGIWCTLSERREAGLPNNLLVIGNTGAGEWYCLETRPDGGEGPVAIIQPADPEYREEVASDFGAFFLERMQAAEEDL